MFRKSPDRIGRKTAVLRAFNKFCNVLAGDVLQLTDAAFF